MWEDLQVGDQGVNGIEAWTLAEVKPTSSANSTSGRNQELGTKRVHFFPKMGRFAKGGKQEGSRTSGWRWREAEREGSRAWREYLERKCPLELQVPRPALAHAPWSPPITCLDKHDAGQPARGRPQTREASSYERQSPRLAQG